MPVLFEENNIANFFSDVVSINYPKDKYEVIFVSTDKEYSRINSGKNTIDIIDELITKGKKTKVSRIHCTDINGGKPTQLNYAINRAKDTCTYTEDYFVFIDADTKFNSEILKNINNTITPEIEYYQIAQNWFKNFNRNSLLMNGFAVLQTYKVFSEEVIKISENIFPYRGKYFVGNGMVIKGSFFNKIPNFSKYIEDVRLGHLSSFLRIRSKSIQNIILETESANKYPVLFKQSGLWFFGCSLIYEDYLEAKAIDNKKFLEKLVENIEKV